jgi:vitamin B12 transporter
MLSRWWRLDLSGSYALTDSTKLFGRIENLTDNRYQDPSGFNTPGFSAYVGLTWNN